MRTRLAIAGFRSAAVLKRRTVAPGDITSVALVELTGLGDVISMLPTIPGFRSLFPEANFHLIVDNNFVEFLQAVQLPVTVHGVVRPKRSPAILDAIHLLRALKPTLVCSMSPPRRNALVALASGAPSMAGYLRYTNSLTPYLLETPVEAFGLLHSVPATYGREQISERAFKVCHVLGLENAPPEVGLRIEKTIAEHVKFDLILAGFLPKERYAVIHPFAGWKFRQWPEKSYGDLAERLLGAGTPAVVFLWEEERGGNLAAMQRRFAGNRRVLFASRLRLLESAVLTAAADLFVGNDSGPLHLAAALGVPAVGLFGPSLPSLTAPRVTSVGKWLYKPTECSPCDQRKCIRPGNPCMNAITVDEVFMTTVSAQQGHAHV